MRNLFLKIFLWFLLTFVIVAVTMVVVTVSTRSNERIRNEISAKASLYLPLEARQSVDIYEREGEVGLKRHFDRLRDSRIVKPYLFDEDGKEVTGGIPPAGAAEITKDAKEDAPIVGKLTGRNGFAAQKVVGTNGKKYTALIIGF